MTSVFVLIASDRHCDLGDHIKRSSFVEDLFREQRRMLSRVSLIAWLRLLASVALFSFVPHVAALEWDPVGGVDNYDPARHNPFARSPEFIAPTLDLSGVGQYHKVITDNYFWATMISDTYFLTASHTARPYD